jgi:hypothetical protein
MSSSDVLGGAVVAAYALIAPAGLALEMWWEKRHRPVPVRQPDAGAESAESLAARQAEAAKRNAQLHP